MPNNGNPVVILGMDAGDPRLIRRWADEGYLPTSDDLLDDHLRTLEAGPSVDMLPSSLIDSIQLQTVSIGLRPWSGACGILQRGTMEPWIRQLLWQWDTRSILTVNYLTYQDGMRGAIMVF